jgi:hypothetical protein
VCARTPKRGREGRPVAPEGPAAGTQACRGPREGPGVSCCVNLNMCDFLERCLLSIELSRPLRTRIHERPEEALIRVSEGDGQAVDLLGGSLRISQALLR